ncbi:MAG: hypothetical protein HY334_06440, partial [Armatimonadetes bacterium]|nr:hypothetical protein [Armatimonadota bacterium]
MTEEFPVTWEDPSDPELSWEWDDMHTPGVLAPLASDYTRVIARGLTYRFEQFGLPRQILCRIINGFTYFADKVDVPESDLPALREREEASRGTQARVVREYWDRTVLPALLQA